MRTTVDIDDDILLVAKEIARRQNTSMGKVISDLSRQALTRQAEVTMRNGIPLFPRRPGSAPVTLELVNQLRDEAL